MEIQRILIVCSGNICRSPMAAALMRRRLGEGETARVRVESAGLQALVGQPADGYAQVLMHGGERVGEATLKGS